MKFRLNLMTWRWAVLLLIRTLGEPLMTEAARDPLLQVVVFLAGVNLVLERWLRPKPGARPRAMLSAR